MNLTDFRPVCVRFVTSFQRGSYKTLANELIKKKDHPPISMIWAQTDICILKENPLFFGIYRAQGAVQRVNKNSKNGKMHTKKTNRRQKHEPHVKLL
ncbi:MAG: hypothetical protein ACRC61_23145 [Aeromonas salmonicida]